MTSSARENSLESQEIEDISQPPQKTAEVKCVVLKIQVH